jgi:E3 ubiquitin-protein ligase makorin
MNKRSNFAAITVGTPCPYGESCFFKHDHRVVQKASANVEDESCSICFEPIIKFGLLPGCDHMFCLSCVVHWRAQAASTSTKSDRDSKRSCPLCREHSDFAMPSYKFFKGAEKTQYITDVLADRARTPCKEYSATQHCKFGGHCFFSHIDVNGKDVKPKQLEVCVSNYCLPHNLELVCYSLCMILLIIL